LGQSRVALDHHLLDEDRAFDRRHDGREFKQDSVAGRLDDPPAKRTNDRGRGLAPLAHELRRPGLVLAHEARIADDVGGKDSCEAAGGGHLSPWTPAEYHTPRVASRKDSLEPIE